MMNPFLRDYSRRDWIKFSVASSLGISVSGWFPRLAKAARDSSSQRCCILLWMNGGPSQTDTFDPKPNHANGGPTKTIVTSVPGIHISEFLPGIAQEMTDLAIIRGMSSKEGDHSRATALMLTGQRPLPAMQYPSLGAIVSKEIGRTDSELPNYVSISPVFVGNAGGPGFLGPSYGPLMVSGQSDDPQARANLSIEDLAPPAGIGNEEMKRRFSVLGVLQEQFASNYRSAAALTHRSNVDRAARMIESQAKHAFKLEEESPRLRDAYGRNRFGQGCLLARRLVERGVPFVQVTLASVPGAAAAWDTHGNNFEQVRSLCGVLDPAWSTLMRDLRERGLLESTLVLWMGEFGRTPTINPGAGRDHFPNAWSVVLGGAGIRAGQFIGDTGPDGQEVKDRPVSVAELYATVCSALKIDPTKENVTPSGRPIAIVDKGGEPIRELVEG
jgi:hypothetical protein